MFSDCSSAYRQDSKTDATLTVAHHERNTPYADSRFSVKPTASLFHHHMKPKVIAYATFASDQEYHLVDSASGYNRTLCDLSTKGSLKKIRQYRPPARVTRETPPPTHAP